MWPEHDTFGSRPLTGSSGRPLATCRREPPGAPGPTFLDLIERGSIEGRLFHRGAVSAPLPESERMDLGWHESGE